MRRVEEDSVRAPSPDFAPFLERRVRTCALASVFSTSPD